MTDPILIADAHEEAVATAELRKATTIRDLQDAWGMYCEHWPEGPARDRLRDTYSAVLATLPGGMVGVA